VSLTVHRSSMQSHVRRCCTRQQCLLMHGVSQNPVYTAFGKITKYTVIYSVYLPFWPTLHVHCTGLGGEDTATVSGGMQGPLSACRLQYIGRGLPGASHRHCGGSQPGALHRGARLCLYKKNSRSTY